MALVSSVVVSACTQPVEERAQKTSSAVGVPWVPPPPLPPSPEYAVVFDAYVGEVGCWSINAQSGTWVAAPVFPGDPAFCSYTWSGGVQADPTSLTNVLWFLGVAPYENDTCKAGICPVPAAAPGLRGPGSGDPGGSVHCVKCVVATIVKRDDGPELHVVLPASMTSTDPSDLRVFITETYGAWVKQPGNAQTFTVPLPGLPNEASLATVADPGDVPVSGNGSSGPLL